MTRDLIANDHVAFITGGLSASVQLAINQVTKAAKVLFNSISQSDAIVAVPDLSSYTFHEALIPHMTSQAVGRYVFSNYLKRVAFLVADYAFGNEMVAGFEAVGEQFGVEIVATVRHPLGTLDFRPYLSGSRPPSRTCWCSAISASTSAIRSSRRIGWDSSTA